MRLDGFRYRLPLRRPLHLAGTSLEYREGALLRLADGTGASSWGDAAPLHGFSEETLDEVLGMMPALEKRMPDQFASSVDLNPDGAWVARLDGWQLPPSLRFGLETAVAEVVAVRRRTSLAHVLSPRPRTSLSLNALITMDDDVTAAVRRLVADGYGTIKIKVGGQSVDADVRRVAEVASTAGPGMSIRLDANRAWTWDEAAVFARGVRDFRFEYIEEPLADPEGLRTYARDFPHLPVALDETVADMQPRDLEHHRYAAAIVLKPTLLGGLVPTLRLARAAVRISVRTVLSATFESGVGLRSLIALAAALPGPDAAHGLDVYHRLADDVLTPRLAWHGGRIDVATVLDLEHAVRHEQLDPVRR